MSSISFLLHFYLTTTPPFLENLDHRTTQFSLIGLCLIDGVGGGLSSLRGEAGWRRPLKCKGKLGIVAGDI